MGMKLYYGGLAAIMAGQYFNMDPFVPKVGAAIMVIGFILMLLDK